MDNSLKEKLSLNFYYCLIFLLSLVVMTVAPMFSPAANSDLGIAAVFPHSAIGWAIYVCTKLFVGIVNLLLFHCFVKQARINIKDNARYIAACEIYNMYHPKEYNPRGPKQYFGQLYRKKGIMIFVTSVLSAVVLTNAILSFDLTAFVTYCMTILMGLVFGILKMKEVESYWTNEFYDAAMVLQRKHQKQESMLNAAIAPAQSSGNSNINDNVNFEKQIKIQAANATITKEESPLTTSTSTSMQKPMYSAATASHTTEEQPYVN